MERWTSWCNDPKRQDPNGKWVLYDDAVRAVAEAEQRGLDYAIDKYEQGWLRGHEQGQRDEREAAREHAKSLHQLVLMLLDQQGGKAVITYAEQVAGDHDRSVKWWSDNDGHLRIAIDAGGESQDQRCEKCQHPRSAHMPAPLGCYCRCVAVSRIDTGGES